MAELSVGTFAPLDLGFRFAGTTHPNMQGVNSGLLSLAALYLALCERRHRYWFLLVAGIGLAFLLLTKSRTALSSTLLAQIFLIAVFSGPRQRAGLLTAAVFLGSLIALWFGRDLVERVLDAALLGRTYDAASLSGRVPLWRDLLEYFSQHPWLGVGYDGFWTPERIDAISESQSWPIASAHSAYLELALSVGVLGLALILLTVVATIPVLLRANRLPAHGGFAFLSAILVFCLVHGVLEASFMRPNLMTALAVAALVAAALRWQPAELPAETGPQAPARIRRRPRWRWG